MTMKMVNINEVKAKLSEFLDAVAQGETVIICNRNQPVAELRAVPKKRTEPRPVGLGKGTIEMLPGFDDPMPEDWLDEMYNGPIFPEPSPLRPSRVAEKSSTDGSRRRKRERR